MFKKLRRFGSAVFIAVIVSIFTSNPTWACSVCGCGDPLASAGSAHPLADTWRVSFENIYLTASAQSDDLTGSTESVRQVNLNTTLSYSPTDDLTLTAMFPLVEKYWSYTPSAAAVSQQIGPDEGTPFGVGDIMAGARYFFLSETDFKAKQHTGMAISAGLYIPTGGTDFTSLITGNNLDTHAQLGTGAWGFYGGLLYNHATDDFTLSANANVVIRTTAGTNNSNSPVYQYTFGSSFTGGVQGQLHLADPFAVSLAVEGRYAASDMELNPQVGPGIVDTPNTGGMVIDLTPGVWWNISGDSTLYAKVQIPTITSFIGVQSLGPTYVFGTQFLIH